MASDFEVHGAAQFLQLSKALKQASETEMRKALHKGLRAAVNREKPAAAAALAAALPSRLASKGAKVKQTVQVKTGRDPGVSVVIRYGKGGGGIGAANAKQINARGTFRHPVYKTGAWVEQKAKAGGTGWFDKAWTNKAPQIRTALEHVLEGIAEDIVKKAR